MKKILFVYDVIYPYQLGGAEKRIYSLSKYLKKDFEINIIGMRKNGMGENFEKNRVHYYTLTKYNNLYNSKGKRRVILSIHFAIDLYFFLIKNNFDIIDATANPYFHIFAIKLALLTKRKTKLFVTWHEYWDKDYWIYYSSPITGRIGFSVQNLALKLSENIISVSKFTKKRLERKTDKDIKLISNGIEDIKIKRYKKIYDLVYTGRIIDFKNIDKILELSNINPQLKILIIGDGPELEKYKDRYINKNITFTGFLKKDIEVYRYLSQSKIFIILSEREGFSISSIEAMNIGLPVICYRGENNAAKDLIENKRNGILATLDLEDINRSIIEIIDNYKFYSINAQKSSEEYLYKKICKDYIKLINSTSE